MLSDIIALNVRTEINFGLFSDGCTALSWLQEDLSILAQNWDVRRHFLPYPLPSNRLLTTYDHSVDDRAKSQPHPPHHRAESQTHNQNGDRSRSDR